MAPEHPNAAQARRAFAAFGRDGRVIAAVLDENVIWRVPGANVMAGEYRGRRAVVDFLRRTGTETDGTYRTELTRVLADDEWVVTFYRARGQRQGRELDILQALLIRVDDGRWVDVTAVPLDVAAFEAFWA